MFDGTNPNDTIEVRFNESAAATGVGRYRVGFRHEDGAVVGTGSRALSVAMASVKTLTRRSSTVFCVARTIRKSYGYASGDLPPYTDALYDWCIGH